jgi:hypothetical protein
MLPLIVNSSRPLILPSGVSISYLLQGPRVDSSDKSVERNVTYIIIQASSQYFQYKKATR